MEKPTVQQIAEFAASKKYDGFDSEAFWAFHESRGWTVGRYPMRSWKGAIITWWQRDHRFPLTTRPIVKTVFEHPEGWQPQSDAELARQGVDLEALRKARESEK
jgi:hypothetical protein